MSGQKEMFDFSLGLFYIQQIFSTCGDWSDPIELGEGEGADWSDPIELGEGAELLENIPVSSTIACEYSYIPRTMLEVEVFYLGIFYIQAFTACTLDILLPLILHLVYWQWRIF